MVQRLRLALPTQGIWVPSLAGRASVVAQVVNSPPAMWDTWVQSLGWEDPLEVGKDPLEEGMATHSSSLPRRIPMDRGAWQATVMGSQRVGYD